MTNRNATRRADTRTFWSAWEGAEIALYDACGRLGVAPASKAG